MLAVYVRQGQRQFGKVGKGCSTWAARTGFPAGPIEKDYSGTVLRAYLGSVAGEHVFKSGTCLATAYGEFSRLSEDMDLAIRRTMDSWKWPGQSWPRSLLGSHGQKSRPGIDDNT